MSEKPNQDNKTKKRRSSSGISSTEKGIRRFLTVLLSVLAVCMTLLVLYMLRNGSTDPRVAEGITKDWVPASTIAATEAPAPTEATETIEATEPVDPSHAAVQQQLERMTLEEKVYQLFFVTNYELTGQYYASTADDATRIALENKPVGGVVFDSDNIFSREQLTAMIADTKSYSEIPLFIGVEEEGGFNTYLNKIGVTRNYSEMRVYGDENATDRVFEIGSEIGTAITGAGFNIDLAPVADTLVYAGNQEIGRRAFSTDPAVTAEMVTQMVKGLRSGGCMSCLKYFPGLSAATADSRYGRAVSNQTIAEIRANLLPFTAGVENGAEMIMVSHLCLPNIVGENTPADLCPQIVNELLRGELGYQGVVMTDSFQKGAISYYYDAGEAAVAAIEAGCDIIYMPGDLDKAAQAILNAVDSGALTEERIDESVFRILLLKYESGLH